MGPGEPERETGPVALPERCFDLCFFLRIEVSVPLPASERIGEPGRLRLERDLPVLAASLSVRILSDLLRLAAEGVVAPEGRLGFVVPSGWRVPAAASI